MLDCDDLAVNGQIVSGVYTIWPVKGGEIQVYCRMSAGRGWIVIQRRSDGLISFEKSWKDYESGYIMFTYYLLLFIYISCHIVYKLTHETESDPQTNALNSMFLLFNNFTTTATL